MSHYTAKLPDAPLPHKVNKAELDELYTFVGKKKNEIYVLTIVDRDTHYVLSWDVVLERTSEALQACLERAPQAKQYYSDAFPVYDTLYYGSPYEMRIDKQETYSVEAVNADLSHHLKRLARKSRCFSRRMQSRLRTFVSSFIVTTIDNLQNGSPLNTPFIPECYKVPVRVYGKKPFIRYYEVLRSGRRADNH